MKNEEVNILIQKYFKGATTLDEERLLRDFFRQGSVPEELEPYREWFTGVSAGSLGVSSGSIGVSADSFGLSSGNIGASSDSPGVSSVTTGVSSVTMGDAVSGGAELSAGGERESFTPAGIAALILESERRKRGRVRSLRYLVAGIAASLVVTLGTFFWSQRQPAYSDSFEDPRQALEVAGETLAFVSFQYNKGLEKLAPLGRLSASVEPVRQPLSTLQKGFGKAGLFEYGEEPSGSESR